MEQTAKPLQVYVVEDSAILAQLIERTVQAAGGELVGRPATPTRPPPRSHGFLPISSFSM
jgi:hypothetical protein